MSDTLDRLQQFYISMCDGDWEHSYGISIETLDNPGWLLRISTSGTTFEGLEIPPASTERAPDDWIHIATKRDEHHKYIECACGPHNLSEAIELALSHLK